MLAYYNLLMRWKGQQWRNCQHVQHVHNVQESENILNWYMKRRLWLHSLRRKEKYYFRGFQRKSTRDWYNLLDVVNSSTWTNTKSETETGFDAHDAWSIIGEYLRTFVTETLSATSRTLNAFDRSNAWLWPSTSWSRNHTNIKMVSKRGSLMKRGSMTEECTAIKIHMKAQRYLSSKENVCSILSEKKSVRWACLHHGTRYVFTKTRCPTTI